jgi:hypothetical protein
MQPEWSNASRCVTTSWLWRSLIMRCLDFLVGRRASYRIEVESSGFAAASPIWVLPALMTSRRAGRTRKNGAAVNCTGLRRTSNSVALWGTLLPPKVQELRSSREEAVIILSTGRCGMQR